MERKSLYELVKESSITDNKNLSIKKSYSYILDGLKCQYIINPNFYEDKKLEKATYSIIKQAFKLYRKGVITSAEIISDSDLLFNKLKNIKNKIENTYNPIGTDAGFYEAPVLGNALDFSIKGISIELKHL